MNKHYTTLLFSLLVAFFCICLPLQAIPGTTRTIIKGNIKNLSVYPKTKFFTLKIIDFRGKETVLKDSIKRDGTFQFEFDLYIAQDISVEPIVGKFIAHPGDNIQLAIDYKNIGYVGFSGDGRKTNQDLYTYLNSNYLSVSYDAHKIALAEERYINYCDSVKNQMVKQRQRFIKVVNPGSEVLKWTNDYIKISYYKALLEYPLCMNAMLMKENKVFYPSSEYYTFLDKVGSVFSNTLLNTEVYELLNSYILNANIKSLNDFMLNNDSSILVYMNQIIQDQHNSIFKQALIGNILYHKLYVKNLHFIAANKTLFDENIQEPFIKKPLDTFFKTLKEESENPQIASATIYKRMGNVTGKLLLDSIISSHKGKVLYLDLWYRGIPSCMDDFAYAKKLMQDYMGKNIEFVYIGLEPDVVEGELELMWHEIRGSHVYCNYDQIFSLNKGFEINIVPYYVLINKQGLITDSGIHLSPSNPETIQKIDKLLSEN